MTRLALPSERSIPFGSTSLMMPLLQGEQPLFEALVVGTGQPADGYEFVGTAADGRTHQNGAVRLQGLLDDLNHLEHGSGVGNRAAAEL